jgi:Tfp pilus assembly protein PilO
LFFDRVAKFPRIIHVSAIDIKGKDRQEPNSTITADCVATTFVLLEGKQPATGSTRVRSSAAAGGARQ